MKISFSTLGCPNWTLSEILAAAKDLGYDGIELRGLGDDIYLPDARLFRPESCGRVVNELRAKGLSVTCISTECTLQVPDEEIMAEARAYIKLAAALGAPNIRLLGDTNPWKGSNVNTALVTSRLRELAPEAEASGVTLLLESNGVYSSTELLRDTIEAVGSGSVAALWDINHPVRYSGETPAQTYANIGRYVRHVHVKDSVVNPDGSLGYRLLGYGTLPLEEAFSLLKANGFDGCISLEWTKRWNHELEDAGIVFSHFIYALRNMWKKA